LTDIKAKPFEFEFTLVKVKEALRSPDTEALDELFPNIDILSIADFDL
jgi:hypothetical protein